MNDWQKHTEAGPRLERTVFLVMGNDFPHAVFSTEEAAAAEIERMKAADDKLRKDGTKPADWRGIYWRTYEFTLDPAEVEAA